MFGKEDNERAVSPVVGVILMVAITVILAAVIGAFVLDLGSDQEENPTAGVTFEQDSDSLTATVIDPGNVDSLSLAGDINTDSDGDIEDGSGDNVGGWDGDGAVENTEVSAGDTATLPEDALNGDTGTVQIVGTVGTSESLIDSTDFDFS